MALYKETITLRKELLDRVNSLLSIEDLNNLTEEEKLLQPETDEIINIASVLFSNGNTIDIQVCGGMFNYYDNSVLRDKDGYEIACFDCSYCIDKEIEFECENDTYIVCIEVQEEN